MVIENFGPVKGLHTGAIFGRINSGVRLKWEHQIDFQIFGRGLGVFFHKFLGKL